MLDGGSCKCVRPSVQHVHVAVCGGGSVGVSESVYGDSRAKRCLPQTGKPMKTQKVIFYKTDQ